MLFRSNNSYMMAGPDGAYILETAASRWAWKKLETPAAISNSYSLDTDYKRVDSGTRKAIAVVNERMACLDESDAGRIADKQSWKTYVEDRFMSRFSAGESRRRAVTGLINAAAEAGSRAAVMAVLRAHAAPDPEKPGRPRNVCDHDADVMGNPTTASMLLEYGSEGRMVLWFTGASYPCSNLYKPVLLENGHFMPLWVAYDYTEGGEGGEAYWRTRRDALAGIRRNARKADGHAGALAAAQATIFQIVDSVPVGVSGADVADAAHQIGAAVAAWDAIRV